MENRKKKDISKDNLKKELGCTKYFDGVGKHAMVRKESKILTM